MSKVGLNILSGMMLRSFAQHSSDLSKASERLSSGMRINHAGDDAAGLAMASALNLNTRLYTQASRNINDAMSMFNVYDSGLTAMQTILGRHLELATQAASGTLSNKQRESLEQESAALRNEYTRVAGSLTFNGVSLIQQNDFKLDFQVGTSGSDTLSFTFGSALPKGLVADGTFGTAQLNDIAANSYRLAGLADMDGDGDLDVIAKAGNTTINIFGNDGEGNFSLLTNLAASGSISSIVSGDFNGDGNIDIGYSVGSSLITRLNDGSGGYSSENILAVGGNISNQSLSVGDFNNDGRDDLAYVRAGASAEVRLSDGSGSFGAVTFSEARALYNTVVGDANGDGNLDLLTLVNTGAAQNVYLGDGSGGFSLSATVSVNSADGHIADVNNDGHADIVLTGGASGTTSFNVALSDGAGGYGAISTYTTGTNPFSSLADVNSDGYLDFIASGMSDSGELAIKVNLNRGDGTFDAPVSYNSGQTGVSQTTIGVGDLNGDGANDIVAMGDFEELYVLTGNGSNTNLSVQFDLSTRENALSALTTVRNASQSISLERANAAAFMSRLQTTNQVNQIARVEYAQAASKITDADIAEESSRFIRGKILSSTTATLLNGVGDIQRRMLDLLE